MPEAVIVATGRTPIGRAVKGSLVECRPDDLAALAVKVVLAKLPQLDRTTSRTSSSAAASPAVRRLQHGARRRPARRARRRPRCHGQPLLLLVAADDPHGRPRHPGGRG